MTRLVTTAAAALTLLAFAGWSEAQQVIDKRQDLQQKRIEQGVKSGQLTRHEAKRLARSQARIEAHEQQALADGSLSKKEKARLHIEQDRASRQIYRQKHDAQRRR